MATVLIVDDSAINRRFLTALLSRHHQVIETHDGAEVVEAAKKHHPDVIVADVMMPVTDGYEMMRRLRADARTSKVPVIFFTAHYGARALALAGGAAWFLTNAESAELLPTIKRVLAGETQQPADLTSSGAPGAG